MSKFMTILFIFLLSTMSAFAIDSDKVKEAIQKDQMSVQDMRKWYSVYKGAYVYVKEYDAVGSNDFADIFDKMIKVRNKLDPKKGNTNFVSETSLEKYKTEKYTPEALTDLADDFFAISEGIRKAIEDAK